ncbi:MAG: glycosyltransferase family 39 protein, partial [Acidobacteriota bacterium]|nr:glycosyltransferase family 39 protein [Acidobacteriota bacterium]
MSGEPTGKPRRGALLAGGVFLLALAARLLYLYQSRDNPSFGAPIVDAGDYDLVARRLLEDRALDVRLFWQPFFYPWFLAAVYGLSAGSILAAKLAQAILGSLTCVLVFFLGRRLYDRTTGWVAAALTALYGPLIFFENELLATGWAAFWSVALLLLVLRAADIPRPLETFGLGAVAALAVLTRPSFLPFVVVAWLWLVARSVRTGERSASLVPLVAAPVAGFALIVAPVASITHSETGRAGFLPASGGLNAYIGNNPKPCDTLAIRPGRDWLELVSMPER